MNTKAQLIYDSFESTFEDKCIVPDELEKFWLLKAIGRFSTEIEPLVFDEETMEFDSQLDFNDVDILGMYMKLFYQEREVSKVNKRASIVTKDLSWDGTNGTKTAEKNHLEYVAEQLSILISHRKTPAYS